MIQTETALTVLLRFDSAAWIDNRVFPFTFQLYIRLSSELSGAAVLLRLDGFQVRYYIFISLPILWLMHYCYYYCDMSYRNEILFLPVIVILILLVAYRILLWNDYAEADQYNTILNGFEYISLLYNRHYNGKRWIDQQAVLQRRGFLFYFSC